MRQRTIFGVTEPTLNAASVAPHQLTNGTAPDTMVHGANMGPTWVLSAPDGPHVGPMNLAIRDADNDVVVTGLVVECGHIPECAASPGV